MCYKTVVSLVPKIYDLNAGEAVGSLANAEGDERRKKGGEVGTHKLTREGAVVTLGFFDYGKGKRMASGLIARGRLHIGGQCEH